ncbi:MAG: hypothetical protein QNL66_03280, partial [Burkholderiaceae bacterium]
FSYCFAGYPNARNGGSGLKLVALLRILRISVDTIPSVWSCINTLGVVFSLYFKVIKNTLYFFENQWLSVGDGM